jgi:hypothetical protein
MLGHSIVSQHFMGPEGSIPNSCYMDRPSHPPRLDCSNYTWRRVQITKLLVMQFSPFSCHLIPLRSKGYKLRKNNKLRLELTNRLSVRVHNFNLCPADLTFLSLHLTPTPHTCDNISFFIRFISLFTSAFMNFLPYS